MPQHQQLLDSLKGELRRRGKTYADVAQVLKLSEASIKRLFSRGGFSLERLGQLCDWLDLEFPDLVRLMEHDRARVSALSQSQEAELVADTRFLLLTLCLLNRWTVEEIIATYRTTETEAIAMLGRLDGMGLIELLPGNRVRLMIARDFAWRPNGPIQRYFEHQIQSEFFHSQFDQPGELRLVVNGMLSTSSNAELMRRMRRLTETFNECHRADENLPGDQRHGTTMVLALRPWEAQVFERLRRRPNTKRFA
ncbi:MAG: helix-turn-helix domain-containing protein [Wenzhouxiangella sp.]